jgi:hypothetical protein
MGVKLRLILREERRLEVFEERCWGEYLDRRGMKCWEVGENCLTCSFVICTLRQV